MQQIVYQMLTSDHTKRRSSRLTENTLMNRGNTTHCFIGHCRKITRSNCKQLLATISFAVSARPSIWPHGTTPRPPDSFSWNLYLMIFRKSVKKFGNWLKSDTNTWIHAYIYDSICWILLRMKNVSHKNCTQNRNTHFIFIIIFFRKSCRLWECGKIWYSQTGHRWQYNTAPKRNDWHAG
jgi:hypothetical protein